ncbi:nose resistant to fluoxetine protein 6-like [Ischnura elegans]|uniref:nose resistant to fluoxetine protein 6-like n=1 Tax=Ischnura elegans TaxID=197161 RepID=UPI001ED89CDA|nr:nose resistant to fluoxetine protein 6-like [Ischnura elegans]
MAPKLWALASLLGVVALLLTPGSFGEMESEGFTTTTWLFPTTTEEMTATDGPVISQTEERPTQETDAPEIYQKAVEVSTTQRPEVVDVVTASPIGSASPPVGSSSLPTTAEEKVTTTAPPESLEYQHLLELAGVNLTSFLALYAPISASIKNEECRKQGRLYLRELQKFTLWASQMFDATTKFPFGILYGSTADMGNFDECIEVDVEVGNVAEEGTHMRGQYCLSTITFDQVVKGAPRSKIDLRNQEHLMHANTSSWAKIELAAQDPSRNARNEVHWGFCIPSACSASDWATHLNYILSHISPKLDVHAVATVEDKMCQVYEPLTLTVGAIILGLVFAIFVMIVSASTFYDVYPYLTGLPRNIQAPRLVHQLIMCFSAKANIDKLLSYKESNDGLECIHGLKMMSLCLIIMGHRLMFNLGSPLTNPEFVEGFYTKMTAMILLNGPIVVDTFFSISGFLVCYLLLHEYQKRKRINVFMLYVHRYVRLTPVYMVVLAFYTTLLVQFGSGPLWQQKVGLEAERCAESWWANVLYINNYVNPEKLCMFQSWYITCDMHLFIISPPIVYLLWKKPTLGKILLLTVTVASIVTSFLVTYVKRLDALLLLYMKTLSDPISNDTFRSMYIPTHTRASPYFIGMAAGYAKYVIQSREIKIPKLVVWAGWLIALVCIEGTVFSAWVFYSPGRPYDPLESALYGAFHRITWSIGTSWIIIAVSTGNGDFLKPFLVWPPIITLSRMTYCAFLSHGALQLYTVASARSPYYGSIYHLIWLSAGDIVLSFGASFVLTLLFESPIIGLEKIILGGGGSRDEDDLEGKQDGGAANGGHRGHLNNQIQELEGGSGRQRKNISVAVLEPCNRSEDMH